MSNHPIEQQIYQFLEDCCTRKAKIPKALIKEFGKRCEKALEKHLVEAEEKEFKLRMSNIGKPLRQLMLEKEHGRATPSPDFLLKMLHGTLDEAFVMFLLKAAGVNITAESKKVTLKIPTEKGMQKIEGELDLKIDNKVWDIKTASPYSYDNKFINYEYVARNDDFGYVGQGVGYGVADGSSFGGWIVRNKATQQLKVVEIPDYAYLDLSNTALKEITRKVNHIVCNYPIPECEGEEPETFYRKETGNYVLNETCKWCPHKHLCHPGVQYRPSLVGKSDKYKYYTKVVEKNEAED